MLETAVGVMGAGLLAVFGWAFQLNSRVAVLEANNESLKELINAQFGDVKERLVRIERGMNGLLR